VSGERFRRWITRYGTVAVVVATVCTLIWVPDGGYFWLSNGRRHRGARVPIRWSDV